MTKSGMTKTGVTKPIPLAHYLANKKRNAAGGAVNPRAQVISSGEEQKLWFSKGFEAGQQAARKEAESALKAHLEEQIRQLETHRQAWVDQESKPLANAIKGAFEGLDGRIADAVAQVLEPFINQQVMGLAIEELCQALRVIITNNKTVQLKIAGQEDLVAKVKAQISGIEVVETRGSAASLVKVEIGDTVIETAVSEWFQKLKELSCA